MAQVDYFKFFKKFPRFIDIDDSDEVKLVLLKEIKKMKGKLLPIDVMKFISVNDLRENGFKDAFQVKYKNNVILNVLVTEKNNTTYVKIARPWTYYSYHPGYPRSVEDKIFMSKEEVKNIKRTILIDDMLKNNKTHEKN